jgi:Gnt-I system high-affinity gluconate transporter
MGALPGIVMLLLYLVAVIVIIRGQSPIISLLSLAVLWALLAGVPGNTILAQVLDKGGTAYASAIIIIVFGAWFGQALVKTGIAENIIRGAIELAGDRPVVVAMVVSVVTGLLFTSLYGVGAAISIGVIALPIMMSMGIPPWVAAPAFTMAIGAGNFINLVEFNIFKPMFPGISYDQPYLTFYITGFAVYILAACAMSFVNLRMMGTRKYSAVSVTPPVSARQSIPWYAYIAPAIPVVMVIAFKWPMIPAFLLGTTFALLSTQRGKRTLRETVDLFHRTFYDAFPDIATIAALWIICGMLIIGGQLPEVQKVLNPVFGPFLPSSRLGLSCLFAALAPLAIYRGPFSAVGTGAALVAMFLNAKLLSPIYLYCVWRGALCLQGSQDPTNSWTLWSIGYTKVTHGQFLKTALPWGWLMVAINAFLAYLMVP